VPTIGRNPDGHPNSVGVLFDKLHQGGWFNVEPCSDLPAVLVTSSDYVENIARKVTDPGAVHTLTREQVYLVSYATTYIPPLRNPVIMAPLARFLFHLPLDNNIGGRVAGSIVDENDDPVTSDIFRYSVWLRASTHPTVSRRDHGQLYRFSSRLELTTPSANPPVNAYIYLPRFLWWPDLPSTKTADYNSGTSQFSNMTFDTLSNDFSDAGNLVQVQIGTLIIGWGTSDKTIRPALAGGNMLFPTVSLEPTDQEDAIIGEYATIEVQVGGYYQ
jgi:hypothetical protein